MGCCESDIEWIFPEKKGSIGAPVRKCLQNTGQGGILEKKLSKTFNLHPVVSQIFVSRGCSSEEEVKDFLYSTLTDLHDPFLFPDMSLVVERLLLARSRKENVVICGDSDVDGITSVALLTEFFRSIDIQTDHLFTTAVARQQGDFSFVQELLRCNASVMVTADWGITAVKDLLEVQKHGIDVVITDHHEVIGKVPKSFAILNPKMILGYPNRELTGVGVVFKLVHAMYKTLVESGSIPACRVNLRSFLDLVALGTITDVGELLGENRILVRYGLKEIKKASRVGLRKLLELVDLNYDHVVATDILLKVAPKLNSLGRLSNPRKGVELLLTRDNAEASQLAQELNRINKKRQEIEGSIFREVREIIDRDPALVKKAAIVISSDSWHSRIIPIISARLAKQYNKPVVVISFVDGIGKGSARTTANYPLLDFLKKCSQHFLSYGGHRFAAGLSIKKEALLSFKKQFIHLVTSATNKKQAVVQLSLDAEVSFSELDYDLMASLDLLEPFGRGNPLPVFYTRAKQFRTPKLLSGGRIKIFLEKGDRQIEGVAVSLLAKLSILQNLCDRELLVAYTPRVSFVPRFSIQLLIRDFKVP